MDGFVEGIEVDGIEVADSTFCFDNVLAARESDSEFKF